MSFSRFMPLRPLITFMGVAVCCIRSRIFTVVSIVMVGGNVLSEFSGFALYAA